jgi:hypothetical protein
MLTWVGLALLVAIPPRAQKPKGSSHSAAPAVTPAQRVESPRPAPGGGAFWGRPKGVLVG